MKLKFLLYIAAAVSLFANGATHCALNPETLKKTTFNIIKKLSSAGVVAIPTIVCVVWAQKYLNAKCSISHEYLTYGRTPQNPDVRCIERDEQNTKYKNPGKIEN